MFCDVCKKRGYTKGKLLEHLSETTISSNISTLLVALNTGLLMYYLFKLFVYDILILLNVLLNINNRSVLCLRVQLVEASLSEVL